MTNTEHETTWTYECPTCGVEVETDSQRTHRDRLPCPDCTEAAWLHIGLQAVAERANRVTLAQDSLTSTVAQARIAGASWQAIGDALGVTKQAAQQRYGR